MTKLLALTVTVAASAAVAACTRVQGSEEPLERPVRIAEARAPEARGGIRYSVTIQPYEQVSLSFKAGGYVDSVLQRRDGGSSSRALQPGDSVTAGTVVARVREADYRERVKQADGSLQEAQVALEKARLDFDRAQTLFAADSLTKPELDSARAAHESAEARLTNMRAQLEIAKLSLADTLLVSPITGVVLERRIEQGTLVGSGTVGFVLGKVADVKAVFGVPDSLVQRLVPGQPIAITTEAFQGRTFPGRITGIAPSADPQSRVFNIEITIRNADGDLKPGMIGTIEIGDERPAIAAASVAVPLSAVVRSANGASGYNVFVVENADGHQVARARAVSLGIAAGNAVAVTDGLASGERVIVMGATLVHDGDKVRVIP